MKKNLNFLGLFLAITLIIGKKVLNNTILGTLFITDTHAVKRGII